MAKAYKCDRCGKYYDDLPEKLYEKIIEGRTVKYRLCVCRTRQFLVPEDVDLCPECLDELHSFINIDKEKKDGSG